MSLKIALVEIPRCSLEEKTLSGSVRSEQAINWKPSKERKGQTDLLAQRETDSEEGSSFACLGFVTKDAKLLKPSMPARSGPDKHECRTCKKVFLKACYLKRHQRCHTGEKPYRCEVCKKKFAWRRYLTKHQYTHQSNGRRFECQDCGLSFTQKFSLLRHINTHSGKKPFSCLICDATFTQDYNLVVHVKRIHEVDRPFQCRECSRRYA